MIEVVFSDRDVARFLILLVAGALGVLGALAIAVWRTGEPTMVIQTPLGRAVLLLETDAWRASAVTMARWVSVATVVVATWLCYAEWMAKWNIGEKNGQWKGGRTVTQSGYILIRVGKDHHLADVRGYAYEHRLVAEEKIGRRLLPGEIVHHTDGNRGNNTKENIEVLPSIAHHRAEHRMKQSKLRKPGEENPKVLCGCGCRTEFSLYDRSGRPRKFVSGHNLIGRKTK